MGAAASTTTGNINSASDKEVIDNIETKKGIVDKSLSENLTNISDLLVQYGKNDTQAIVNKIKSMEEFRGKIPDSVLAKASSVHKSILDTIDSSLSDTDKNRLLETDSGIADHIKMYVDKEMDAKMSSYLDNPFIKNDPIIQKSMSEVTSSIKTIRGKYKYFEYKYIQMNMFLILFTKHVHTTVSKFIDESAAFYEAREKYHLVLIHNVVKIFQDQLGDETKKLTDLDTAQFSTAIKELTTSVMDSIGKQKQLSEKLKQESLADILTFLMQREEDFATDIIKATDDFKKGRPVAPAQQQQQQPNRLITTPGPTPTTTLRGGFIRDNSLLPQDFFKL
jgi:hypothetical protein